jgi:hypothetical protein
MMYDGVSPLIVIARGKQHRIISRVAFARGDAQIENLFSEALATARSKLLEHSEAVRAEVHYFEFDRGTSSYNKEPLAVITMDDIGDEEREQQDEEL